MIGGLGMLKIGKDFVKVYENDDGIAFMFKAFKDDFDAIMFIHSDNTWSVFWFSPKCGKNHQWVNMGKSL